MPKLVSVHTNSKLTECPDKWARYKDVPVECAIYESEHKDPGKRWFYIFDDSDPYTVSYFHCSVADTEYSDDGKKVVFSTASGSKYVIELGDEQGSDYVPYVVIGHGATAELVPGTAAVKEILEKMGR